MYYQVKQEDSWTKYHGEQASLLSFFEGLLPEGRSLSIAAAGAGGKTTLLWHLAREGAKQKKRVLVTTTTHMLLPEHPSPLPAPEGAIAWLGTPVPSARPQSGWVKCQSPAPEFLEKYRKNHTLTLTEADGSRMLPVKIPDIRREPVIPEHTDILLILCGLSALDQPLSQVCQRWELINGIPSLHSSEAGFSAAERITPKLLGTIMRDCYLHPLSLQYPQMLLIPVWNQADTKERILAAKKAARFCGRLQLITSFYQ